MKVRLFFVNGAVTDYDEVENVSLDRNARVIALQLTVYPSILPRTPDRIGVPVQALRFWEEYD